MGAKWAILLTAANLDVTISQHTGNVYRRNEILLHHIHNTENNLRLCGRKK
jgi:hypothetical protein